MFPQLKWYYVVVAYVLAPSLAFCNAYGVGLTDMNMAYNYGKVALCLHSNARFQDSASYSYLPKSNVLEPGNWDGYRLPHGTSKLLSFLQRHLMLEILAVNLVRDISPQTIGKWMPLPMAMALPFLVGAYFAIDMCLETLIVFVWQKLNAKKAEVMVPAVASGLICGEGLWILPASILALAKINPPICLKFLPS
ncbi:hypothetical protein PTKIN_Ptkin04bG0167400 [Pterospermum kingtungense]